MNRYWMIYHESKRQSVGEDFSQRLPSQPGINSQPALLTFWHTLKQRLHQPDGYRLNLKSVNATQTTAES